MFRHLLHLALLVGLAGCADYKVGAMEDNASAPIDDDTGDSSDADTAPEPVPTWYVVRAELTILGGLAVADGAAVQIDVVDADLERIDCTFALPVTDLRVPAAPPAEAGVWWELPVEAPEDACARLPGTLTLGVSELHPDVRARLGTVNLDDVADSLYGAWILVEGATEPSVYGYAGTAVDLAGDDVAALPPPDGTYTLAPLYLLELPG